MFKSIKQVVNLYNCDARDLASYREAAREDTADAILVVSALPTRMVPQPLSFCAIRCAPWGLVQRVQ